MWWLEECLLMEELSIVAGQPQPVNLPPLVWR